MFKRIAGVMATLGIMMTMAAPASADGPSIPGNATGASTFTPPPVYQVPPDFVPPTGSWPLPPVPTVQPILPAAPPPVTAPLPYGPPPAGAFPSRLPPGYPPQPDVPSATNTNLIVTNIAFYRDINGATHLLGQVLNLNTFTAVGVTATVTFYNIYGQAVTILSTLTTPPDLLPDGLGIFDVSADLRTAQVVAYTLSVGASGYR